MVSVDAINNFREGKDEIRDLDNARMLTPLTHNAVDTRIIGGQVSNVDEFPYYVNLTTVSGCGGTLIAPRIVLTAGHCFGRYINATISVGSGAGNPNKQVVKVKDSIRHPGMGDPTMLSYDFRLLLLESPGAEIQEPRAVISPLFEEPSDDTLLTIIGLGKVADGEKPTQLHHAEVPVVNTEDCINMYDVTNGQHDVRPDLMFCAGDIVNGGIDSCNGDSGGPAVYKATVKKHEVVGVTSWGNGCGDAAFPGVYAKVSTAFPWIKAQVCDEWNADADFCDKIPTNDNACNATSLEAGGSILSFTLDHATAEVGEVRPDIGTSNGQDSCHSNNGWCQSEPDGPSIQNSIWYTVIGPHTGCISIETSGGDTQLALWYVNNDSECSNFDTAFTQVAANDDSGIVGGDSGGGPESEYAAALTNIIVKPGIKYYVQLDSWNGQDVSGGKIKAEICGSIECGDSVIPYDLVLDSAIQCCNPKRSVVGPACCGQLGYNPEHQKCCNGQYVTSKTQECIDNKGLRRHHYH